MNCLKKISIAAYLIIIIFNCHLSLAQTKQSESLVLFGFWGLNGFLDDKQELKEVKQKFNLTVFQVACEDPDYTVHTLLPLVQKANLKVTLRLTGDHQYYTTDGDFDIRKWKKRLSIWKHSGLKKYIKNGTLGGHMLLDDIYSFSGNDPTAEDIDAMARYSKKIFPGLMTFVRNQASIMPKGKYQYLDAIDNQYSIQNGSIDGYVKAEHKAAKQLGLQIINGLNLCDGGDGSSGQRGWRKDGEFYAMSADEIAKYGKALLKMPDVLMFLMWEYDGEEFWSDGTIGSDYFNQPDLQQALSDLGKLAKNI